jgi:uncharacterized RDD family membrane protein YckC
MDHIRESHGQIAAPGSGAKMTTAEEYVASVAERMNNGTRSTTCYAGALIVLSPVVYLCTKLAPPDIPTYEGVTYVVVFGGCLLLGIYTAIAEARTDRTIGKRVMGRRVVRESGGRISGRQAVVRQLPRVLQVIWVDALFALFTERRQRAFELLSKTRVVSVTPQDAEVARGG